MAVSAAPGAGIKYAATTTRSPGIDRRWLPCDSDVLVLAIPNAALADALERRSSPGFARRIIDGMLRGKVAGFDRRPWQRGGGDARSGLLAVVAMGPHIWLKAAILSFNAMTFGR